MMTTVAAEKASTIKGRGPRREVKAMDETLSSEILDVAIQGMGCGECAARIEAALKELPGIASVRATPGRAHVAFQPAIVSRVQIVRRIESLGYAVDAGDGKPRGRLAGWLDRLARSNAANFGESRIDCCTLGRKRPDEPGRPAR
jgi:copper chaperone CopZ